MHRNFLAHDEQSWMPLRLSDNLVELNGYFVEIALSLLLTANGKKIALTDSIYKHGRSKVFEIFAQPGATLKNFTDNIRFGKRGWNVKGVSRILIHGGANSMFERNGQIRRVTIFEVLEEFKAIRTVIRRENSSAILIFSSILPRRDGYLENKSYIAGINFALEKWCARSKGSCVFLPSYVPFIKHGKPNKALLSDSDGLHPCGAGVSKLDSLFEQAFSSEFLLDKVLSERVRILRGQPSFPGRL